MEVEDKVWVGSWIKDKQATTFKTGEKLSKTAVKVKKPQAEKQDAYCKEIKKYGPGLFSINN